jgi:hypothetical protein
VQQRLGRHPGLVALGEVDLLLGGEQRDLPDRVEVLAHPVGGARAGGRRRRFDVAGEVVDDLEAGVPSGGRDLLGQLGGSSSGSWRSWISVSRT